MNKIFSLVHPDGFIASTNQAIVDIVEEYFSQLFTSQLPDPSLMDKVVFRITLTITQDDYNLLNAPTRLTKLSKLHFNLPMIRLREVTHSLVSQSFGKVGWMALKLDMEKSFDRIEWPFLCKVMEKFAFSEHFIKPIISCVSSTSFSFSANNQVHGHLLPTHDIR
uniref:Reverse transcriptase domain-containing protein n=1 Tax=Cannabis sativa TaxID=3483 RepID=A0A803PB19_CANSA